MTNQRELARAWSGCCDHCDKIAYPDRKLARQARGRMHRAEKRLYAYRCPVSGFWHLGHRRRGSA